jgi:hypothetical protein
MYRGIDCYIVSTLINVWVDVLLTVACSVEYEFDGILFYVLDVEARKIFIKFRSLFC